MALGLTPEHLELAAAVRGWSQRHCPADAVRAAADGEDSGAARYRAELAPSLAGQGLLGLHLPEDAGGQGYGLPELAVALEETGRALLPGAFLPTVLASAVLAEMETGQPPSVGGPAAKLIARLADGSLAGAVCLATGLTGIRGADGGLTVSGESGPVLAGSMADVIIAGVGTADGEAWVALDAADLAVSDVAAVDLTRRLAGCWPARTAPWSPNWPRSCSAPRRAASPTGRCTPPRSTPRPGTSSAGRSGSSRRSSTGVPGC